MLVLLVFAAGIVWGGDYLIHNGEFEKTSHTTIGINHLQKDKVFYIGYDFMWEGNGKPTLEKVEFIKKDGTIISKDDNELMLQPFISKTDLIGALEEDDIISRGLNKDLLPVKGTQIENDFQLVLRVELGEIKADDDIEILRITYKKYGITQFQNIPFDDGIID